jgi:hypothetical protein
MWSSYDRTWFSGLCKQEILISILREMTECIARFSGRSLAELGRVDRVFAHVRQRNQGSNPRLPRTFPQRPELHRTVGPAGTVQPQSVSRYPPTPQPTPTFGTNTPLPCCFSFLILPPPPLPPFSFQFGPI